MDSVEEGWGWKVRRTFGSSSIGLSVGAEVGRLEDIDDHEYILIPSVPEMYRWEELKWRS